MNRRQVSRREFLGRSALIGGGALAASLAAPPARAAAQIVITDPGGEWQQPLPRHLPHRRCLWAGR